MVDRGIWVPAGQRVAEALDVNSRELVERAALVGADRWEPAREGQAKRTRNRGYLMSSLYSTLGLGWSRVMGTWFAVKDHRDKLRVFVNQILAAPWKEEVVVTDIDQLRAKAVGAHPEGQVPPSAVALIGGVDVQLHVLYYILRAYGPGEESWLVRAGTAETFEDLYQILFETDYPVIGGHAPLRCQAAAADTRYRQDEVFDWAYDHDPLVYAVQGHQELEDRYKPRPREFYPHQARRDPRSMLVYAVNTSFYKSKLHRLARMPEGSPGGWHLHADTSEEYLRQFTAEHQVWRRRKGDKRSILRWEPKREGLANHYLDCEVYCAALADILNFRGLQPREVAQARQQRRAEAARRIGAKALRMPDGRPFLVTRR